ESAAQVLAGVGLGRGKRVAVALPNGPEMVIAMLALLSSRAACAPLNPALDENAGRASLSAMRIDALIVAADVPSPLRRTAKALGLRIIEMVEPRDPATSCFANVEALAHRSRADRAEPDDLALLMATSGTTGRPKIVPVSQNDLLVGMRRQLRGIEVTNADRCLCVAPLFTTSGIRRNLLGMLLAGGSVVCVPSFRAEAFVDWIRTFRPTYYSGGPAVHLAILQHHEPSGPIGPSSMRFVLSGATSLPVDVERRLEAFLGVPVIQGLGLSEAGLVACNRMPPGIRRPGSVGLPCEVEVAIHDDAGRPLPHRKSGEVVVRGPGVIRGYEANPEANRDSFRDGWFRTGDLGYFDDDGYLFLTGRAKELINRGGFKVSPFEVDAALLRHPDVVESATFAVPHGTLGEDVDTAVVVKKGSNVTSQALRDFAFAELAPYKVPSQILLVQALPKSPLGKINRRELATRFGEALRGPFEPPRNARETEVARLFAGVLGISTIGAFDNFFYLGGDSLRGAQVIAQLNALHGSRITTTLLFQRPTVAEFAAELDAETKVATQPGLPPIVPLERLWATAPEAPPASGENT
ncbi:MAG TPA: non-ribosomal peptide synthetase, partial [Casimicrobiaceae bacterium]|nr:non-ribosomal peptide synthetase [Casimicrobiaceae bacterium]